MIGRSWIWFPLLCLSNLTPNGAILTNNGHRDRRSIELSAAHALISDTKLPTDLRPTGYSLDIRPNVEEDKFSGHVIINVTWVEKTNIITLHCASELEIDDKKIVVTRIGADNNILDNSDSIEIRRADQHYKRPIYEIYLRESQPKGTIALVELHFSGHVWKTVEGLFFGTYTEEGGEEKKYLATFFRPNNARKLFPCFDEPSFKVPISFQIARPVDYTTLFVTPLRSTEQIEGNSHYVLDIFEKTPPIATFAFGFVISQLKHLENPSETFPEVRIWARDDSSSFLYEKVNRTMVALIAYLGVPYPLPKLDLVVIPGLSALRPIDNYGLIVFRDSDIQTRGYYALTQELVYNWIGSWITPYWWSDAHVNKALSGFLAANIALELDNVSEFDGKWPMTALYSIYYEFSKRYPHSRITGMKMETTCSKTELVLRMLNLTLGGETFRKGLNRFISEREGGNFLTDDVWEAMNRQAHEDKTLDKAANVGEIVNSWIGKDRIPVVNVKRNYKERTAAVTQRVYLRERPHDVPERDKMLWWIPLVIVEEDNLDFTNTRPRIWLRGVKDVTLDGLPDENKFIIANPEEIGPFPVNYDDQNWKLLAKYLQTDKRTRIPIYTRAKLLHDAWNLAYAGNLSFALAFDMTLFLKSEREHLVWNPVFTMIDHIGRHIDMSKVHKKFEKYVTTLLTPLYEELGPEPEENEPNWKKNLRNLSKVFLCQAGYKPCIEEAQKAYRKWMESANPDAETPVDNQYICPVFKWGTQDEWLFGLQRVINFPSDRRQSERTYLLKNLAGCPIQQEKIETLLNITMLEENGNFSETDITLICKILSGGSSGYTTLFNFLSQNWDEIRARFQNRTNLWDNLISSSTGVFTTQEGYEMVKKLYDERKGQFGSAEHIIAKSLKNIKEETKWSDENLPVIEKWLDNYLKQENSNDVKFMGRK